MSDGNLFHLGSAVLMFAAAIVPIYLSLKLKSNFRILSLVGSFHFLSWNISFGILCRRGGIG
jgi:hypothetical protein